jgi:hypothetical protein
MPNYNPTEEKTWIDYRIEEMEEKAGAIELPVHDMDGSRYQPDEYPISHEDAYYASMSFRIGWRMGIVAPEELPERMAKRYLKTRQDNAVERMKARGWTIVMWDADFVGMVNENGAPAEVYPNGTIKYPERRY